MSTPDVATIRIGSSPLANSNSEPGTARITVGLSRNPGNIKLIVPGSGVTSQNMSRENLASYSKLMTSEGHQSAGDGNAQESIQLMPKESSKSTPSRQTSVAGTRQRMLELHIGLPDLTHITISVDRNTKATEVMDIVIDTLQLERNEARRVLSLWLMSEDLEVQLKPTHSPISLFAKWPIYLRKYTELPEEVVLIQKPQLLLRRNVYLSREEDLECTDIQILQLLFYEARCNIMEGTYPCERDTIVKLAGEMALMQYGPYKEAEHTTEFYKKSHLLPIWLDARSKDFTELCSTLGFYHNNAALDEAVKSQTVQSEGYLRALIYNYLKIVHTLPYYGDTLYQYVPPCMADKIKPASMIEDIMTEHSLRADRQPETRKVDSMKRYLTICAEQIPYYGCAIFVGYIDRAHKSFLKNSRVPVNIALNTAGIYIINSDKNVPILGVLYEHLTWEFINVCECEEPSCEHNTRNAPSGRRYSLNQRHGKNPKMTCILLQYPAEEDPAGKVTKYNVLRVYTKAARLIDAFIDNCSNMMKERLLTPTPSPAVLAHDDRPSLDAVDGANNDRQQISALEKATRELCKPEKLSCQHFDAEGKCIDESR